MSEIPPHLRYTKEHEWARRDEDGRIVVGITDFAQEQLGDIVYLELPEAGQGISEGEPLGEIESTKSVSDIYSPVGGTVVESNAETRDNPAAVNQDPYGEGWLVIVEPSDPMAFDGLMSPEEYAALVAEESPED